MIRNGSLLHVGGRPVVFALQGLFGREAEEELNRPFTETGKEVYPIAFVLHVEGCEGVGFDLPVLACVPTAKEGKGDDKYEIETQHKPLVTHHL
jgi:hypothetical protein